MADVYGIDTNKKYTKKNIRNAIIRCFILAHSEALENNFKDLQASMNENDFENFKRINANNLIRRFFSEIGGDFDNPSKENLVEVSNKLADFSKSFRSEEIIDKHYSEIMKLVNNLK